MSNPDYSVQLVLAEPTAPGTGAPPTFRLDLKAQKGLKSGQALVLQVMEASAPGGDAKEIDRFAVRVVQQGATWVFRDVFDPRPATHPARMGRYHLTDHFQLVLPGVDGALVCILPVPDLGIPLPAFVSVKATDKDKPLESACSPRRVMRQFRAGQLTNQFEQGARMAMQAIADGFRNRFVSDAASEVVSVAASDARPNLKEQERRKKEQREMAILQAQQQYQKFLSMQDSPLKIQGLRIQQYHQNLAIIMDWRRDMVVRGVSSAATENLELQRLIDINKSIEAEAEKFLDISVGIPEDYKVRAKNGKEHKEFVDKMAALENNFFFELLCCVPLGGLAKGFVQLAQGKYAEGLLSIGLEAVTYGSFKMMAVLRSDFNAFQAANQTMRRAVFEVRYLKLFTEAKEARLTLFKMAGTVGKTQMGFLGPLFDLGAECRELLDEIKDIAMILRRKDEIRGALQTAGNISYKNWLEELAKTNKKLVWFGAIRAAAIAFKAGKVVNDARQDALAAGENQLRSLDPKTLKEKVAKGFESLAVLLPETEQDWMKTEFVGLVRKMDDRFFDPAEGFLAEWQQDKLEWEAEIRRLKLEELRSKQEGPRLFKSKEEMLADLDKLMGYWKYRNSLFLKLFDSMDMKHITPEKYETYQPAMAFHDDRLDVGMASFLAQIGDVQCLFEQNTLQTTSLRDLVKMGIFGNRGEEKVIYINSNFEEQATRFINLLHGEAE